MPTLQVILEAVARLGPTYLLNEAGYEWSAGELLQRLHLEDPALLALPVSLLRPHLGGAGAIYPVDQAGQVQSAVPLYSIERHPPPVPAPEAVGADVSPSEAAEVHRAIDPSW